MRSLNSRRFIVNKRTHHELHNTTTNKFLCTIIAFIAIVIILTIIVVYFAITFPLIESPNKTPSEFISKVNEIRGINPLIQGHTINSPQLSKYSVSNIHKTKTTNIYNKTESILTRHIHQSSIHLEAKPFLVGLGAEKSGSTSLGAAMFNSGEFTCPDNDEIDVETKYWSNCFGWDALQNNNFINNLQNKVSGHCSIKSYLRFQRWTRNGKYKFEKSVDYLGLPYIAQIFSDIFVSKHGTKIFVMIRYPPPRISSTWKFFVGSEKDKMPNEYGNPERFARHLLNNNLLIELIGELSNDKTLFELDWKNNILQKWNEYMLSLMEQCKMEAVIALFKPEYCNPSQLLRRAVGLSCYIIPIMQWIMKLGIDNAINSYRIIQSELYFKNGKDIMDRLICWSKQGSVNVNECNLNELYESGSIKIKKLQQTKKIKGSNDFSDELINELHSVFMPCNNRLFQLLQLYPQLALKEFDWNDWKFKPTGIKVVE
eukprot:11243_1